MIIVGSRASLEIVAGAPSYWSVTFNLCWPWSSWAFIESGPWCDDFISVPDTPGSTGTVGWCNLQSSGTTNVGFVDVFAVVCWISLFAVFTNGPNSWPTKYLLPSECLNDQLWFNQLERPMDAQKIYCVWKLLKWMLLYSGHNWANVMLNREKADSICKMQNASLN